MTETAATPPGRQGLSALRATLPGVGASLSLWAVCAVAGVFPEGTSVHAALGTGLAALAALLLAGLHGAMASRPARGEAVDDGARVTRALALGFLVKLGALGAGAGALALLGAKFGQLAAFALAFAVAVMLCQGVSAFLLARELSRRPTATEHR